MLAAGGTGDMVTRREGINKPQVLENRAIHTDKGK